MIKHISIILFSFFLSVQIVGQGNILLNHASVHVGNGEVVNDAVVGVVNGRIKFVRNALVYTIRKKEWDTIIDLKHQNLYPGFVAPSSTLGLTEIDAVRASNDFEEIGEFNPHIRALIAYNVESTVISTVRTNGVLLAQSSPRGGTISGSSSVMHLGGWNWEDAVAKKDDGIHINWPRSLKRERWGERTKKANKDYREQKAEIEAFFEAAKNYHESVSKQKTDLRFLAMQGLFTGKKRLYFHAHEIQQMLDIIEFSKKFGIKYPVIVGGYESYLIAERLRDAGIPVMIQRVHSLPMREDDPVDLPYRLPAILKEKGVLFCLQNEGDMEAMNARNIPFLAGTAHAYGLSQEEAIRAISLDACKIMGIDEDYGSIEQGKVATLFVSDGNALEMKENKVTMILMNGQFIDLNNHQLELYKKYRKKYGL